jgi:hypothetical protein
MRRPRKTEAQRRAERDAATASEWEHFRPRLAAIRSYKDALILAASAPAETAPGRKFYSNLGFFLQSFRVPTGASYEERQLYFAMFAHFEAEGAISPEVRAQVETAFRKEMERP